jgi:hypothetical protein
MTVPCRLAWLVPFPSVCGDDDRRAIQNSGGHDDPTRVLNNLTVIEQHMAREATDVNKTIELYTDDIVWESPARDLIFQGKEAVANNYRNMFSSIRDIEVQPLERFATEDREGRKRLRVLAHVMRPTTLNLFDRVGIRPGMACLDVGCGGGDVTFELADLVGPKGRVV